jgi:hypothetical protein
MKLTQLVKLKIVYKYMQEKNKVCHVQVNVF